MSKKKTQIDFVKEIKESYPYIDILGEYNGSTEKILIKSKFWKVNIWLIAFIPLSLIYNIVFSRIIAPYPLVYSNTYYKFVLFWIVYIVICSIITYLQIRKEKKTSSAL